MAAVLEIRLTGGTGNTSPNSSFGGIMSSTALSGTALNNLYDNVNPTEATAGDIEYRAIDIYNSGDATAVDVDIYWSVQTTSAQTSIELQVDATSGNPHTASFSLQTITNENSGPTLSSSYYAYDVTSPLRLANIPSSYAARIWTKRIVTAGAGNLSSDLCTLTVQYA